MNSILFLKAAYIVAWVIYLGYVAYTLSRLRRARQEMKELDKSSGS